MVFARTPELGGVKTRLQPELDQEGCYQLHEALVSRAIKTAVQSDLAPVEVWHTGNAAHDFWKNRAEEFPILLKEQVGDDLGARMLAAVKSALISDSEAADWVILIGSDCPDIDGRYLREASEVLASGQDVVVGPAEDGGYVLIGLRRPHEFLFRDIPWGTGAVLEQTLVNARKNKCSIHQMSALRDLDVSNDLSYYRDKFSWINSIFPENFIKKRN